MGLVVVYHIQSYQCMRNSFLGAGWLNIKVMWLNGRKRQDWLFLERIFPVASVVSDPQLPQMEEGEYNFCCCSSYSSNVLIWCRALYCLKLEKVHVVTAPAIHLTS